MIRFMLDTVSMSLMLLQQIEEVIGSSCCRRCTGGSTKFVVEDVMDEMNDVVLS